MLSPRTAVILLSFKEKGVFFLCYSFSMNRCFVFEYGCSASEIAVWKSLKECILQGGAFSCPFWTILHTSFNMFTLLASVNKNKRRTWIRVSEESQLVKCSYLTAFLRHWQRNKWVSIYGQSTCTSRISEYLNLTFLSSLSVIRVNLFHPWPSLFCMAYNYLYGIFLS